jgi:hypothetical protein
METVMAASAPFRAADGTVQLWADTAPPESHDHKRNREHLERLAELLTQVCKQTWDSAIQMPPVHLWNGDLPGLLRQLNTAADHVDRVIVSVEAHIKEGGK